MNNREIIALGDGVLKVSPATYQKISEMALANKSQREIFESIGASEVEIEYGRTHYINVEVVWDAAAPE